MAFFVRSGTPPQYNTHRSYKRFLRLDFRFRCAYCEVTEGYLRGPDFLGADHFRPYKTFPHLDCVYNNLYYCCNKCNSYKGTTWPSTEQEFRGFGFTDPCVEDPYIEHISVGPDGKADSKSLVGEYTIRMIRLDREDCRRFRAKREVVRARIQEYRTTLAELDSPPELVDLLKRVLEDAEAEWAELFFPEPSSLSSCT